MSGARRRPVRPTTRLVPVLRPAGERSRRRPCRSVLPGTAASSARRTPGPTSAKPSSARFCRIRRLPRRAVVGRRVGQTHRMTASIRPYRSDDLDALYDVCVRTADKGDDLTGHLVDPMLPGHVYAGPYGVFEPESAFVVADAEGVGGYVIGTTDTSAFEARLEAEWFPSLRAKYPEGSGR